MSLDASAFFTDRNGDAEGRSTGASDGTRPSTGPGTVSAALPLPVGATIRGVDVSYRTHGVTQDRPLVEIVVRRLGAPTAPEVVFAAPLGGTAAPFNDPPLASFNLERPPRTRFDHPPVVIEPSATYALRCRLPSGSWLHGVSIGFVAPRQEFTPFVGTGTRLLDTRELPHRGKIQPNGSIVVATGAHSARSAVIHLAVTDTEGSGWLAVFPSDTGHPGNASINWSRAGQILSNTTITALDPAGTFTIQCGVSATHVVVDAIGYFV
jgi:hypothetical protein